MFTKISYLIFLVCFIPTKDIEVVFNTIDETIAIHNIDVEHFKKNNITVHFGNVPYQQHQSKISGKLSIENSKIKFTPKYGFSSGASYTIFIKEKNTSIKRFLITVPKENLKSTTYIENVYPTASNLPMNQLKLYIEFSDSMKEGFSLDQIKLYKLPGRELVKDAFLESLVELWDTEKTRLTIFFDPARIKTGVLPNLQKGLPLILGNSYELVIQKEWLDYKGVRLVKGYKKIFHISSIDSKQPSIKDWEITFPNNFKKQLEIDFKEAMDYGLLHSSFVIIDSEGKHVKGKIVIKNNENLWSFSPEGKWEKGKYNIIVNSWLEDLAGNSLRKKFDVLNGHSSPNYTSKNSIIPFNIN